VVGAGKLPQADAHQQESLPMSQLVFDDDLANQLETLYRTRDVLRRRRLVREALGAAPGERVLDVGCGPGFYVAELLSQVGATGSVVGVDASPQTLALARRRTQGQDNVALHQADATALPVADASFDRALSVQVLEYVSDTAAALAELHRALRPGGRLVVWDVDWSTVSWHSADPDRMHRVLAVWAGHLADPCLPRTLAARLRSAGFGDIRAEGHTFASAEFTPDSYGARSFR
jgi:SAM-dependent methyltransferase